MTVATTYARAELGIEAPLVTVEADVAPGLPQVQIVGLPQTAVKESKDRVKAAIISSGFEFPSKRVTVNLAPADLPKSGGRFDLAIAIAILSASGKLPGITLTDYEWLGELSLTGQLRSISGVLPAALRSRQDSRLLIVPTHNQAEAALADSPDLGIADSLQSIINTLNQSGAFPRPDSTLSSPPPSTSGRLSEVKGQEAAKRALIIAATGGHNLLLIGPPGTGKTMLATRLPALIPPMTQEESLEVASVASVSKQQFSIDQWGVRPFRTPHHTASAAALVGGYSPPRPGEISLAHQGVLFLDELPEYSRHVLEVLREPLESGEIWISRAAAQVRYPARFQLIAAMNPCPCGYLGDARRECECTPDVIHRYRSRLSGPLLDRIDMHVEVPPLPAGTLSNHQETDAEALELASKHRAADQAVAEKIATVRTRILKRQRSPNYKLDNQGIAVHCQLNPPDARLLDQSVDKLGISTRGYFKILKVARTIADLAGEEKISSNHLIEALGYRRLDRRAA